MKLHTHPRTTAGRAQAQRNAPCNAHATSAARAVPRPRRAAAAAASRKCVAGATSIDSSSGSDSGTDSTSSSSSTVTLGRRGALAAAAAATDALFAALPLPPRAAAAKPSSVVSAFRDPDSGREIVTTATGIKYADIEQGSGDTPRVGDLVMCDVVLALEDGRTILDTRAAGAPIAFQVGVTSALVPEGLDEVVRGMRAGSTRLAVVPAALGYGAKGATPRGATAPVPGNADLYYEVELLRCQQTPLGLACCPEATYGSRGAKCVPDEALAQLEKMFGGGAA